MVIGSGWNYLSLRPVVPVCNLNGSLAKPADIRYTVAADIWPAVILSHWRRRLLGACGIM